MGWQQLTLTLISTLAWPAVIIFIMLVLRPRKEK